MKILITGAAGFIGHHMVEHFLRNTDWELALVDKLSYASTGLSRLRDIQAFEQTRNRVNMFTVDISNPIEPWLEREIGGVDYIVHLAAETHVDNSIEKPEPFIQSNVVGTMQMLQYARRLNSRLKKFIYFSTDEVFGPAPKGVEFKEGDRYNSTNPYSASKAAGEELAVAWANTYGLPVLVTHCMNCFGERQHPEKFVPMVVRKILRNELIMVHSDRQGKPGSRSYIHCRNVASAIQFLMEKHVVPQGFAVREKFNIKGQKEVDNLAMVQAIHGLLQEALKREFPLRLEMVDYHSKRPGHDLRYALSGSKMEEMGWTPPTNFEESLAKTIRWMVDQRNMHWLFVD